MKLYSVYEHGGAKYVTLMLFRERQNNQYLSHVQDGTIPKWEDQKDYIDSHPYTYWYGAYDETPGVGFVGACWVDPHQHGIYVLNCYQRRGYGERIMQLLMETHPEMQYTGYVHPENIASLRLHEKLGFRRDHVRADGQVVFKYPTPTEIQSVVR